MANQAEEVDRVITGEELTRLIRTEGMNFEDPRVFTLTGRITLEKYRDIKAGLMRIEGDSKVGLHFIPTPIEHRTRADLREAAEGDIGTVAKTATATAIELAREVDRLNDIIHRDADRD